MFFIRFAPLLATITTFSSFAVGLLAQQRQTLLVALVGSIVLTISIGVTICWRRVSIAKAIRLLFSPLLIIISTWLFLLAMELTAVGNLVWWAALLGAVAVGIYVYVIMLYLHARPRYQAHALENIANYVNVVSVFFMASGLGILRIFLSLDWWVAPLCVLAITLAAWWHLMAISDVAFSSFWLYGVVSGVVLAEIIAVAFTLPTSVYVPATAVAVSYYVISGSSRNWLLHITERSAFIRYAVIGCAVIVITLVTARWIS